MREIRSYGSVRGRWGNKPPYPDPHKESTDIGLGIIGSGAVGSAHRTVIQKRLKLSGQRWSKRGVGNMLKLRTTKMNNS